MGSMHPDETPATVPFISFIGWASLIIGILAVAVSVVPIITSLQSSNSSDFHDGISMFQFGICGVISGSVLAIIALVARKLIAIERLLREQTTRSIRDGEKSLA